MFFNALGGGRGRSLVTVVGGAFSESNGYWYHTFDSSGSLVVDGSVSVEYAVVPGGGGGGGGTGGGGGGGYPQSGSTVLAAGTYPIVVGAGGAGGSGIAESGSAGGSSSFNGVTATGGGGGGCNAAAGISGSCGGGAGYTGLGANGTVGGKGGNGGIEGANYAGGGGGGASSNGANASSTVAGNGGAGVTIFGLGYGGGGGGGTYSGGTLGVGTHGGANANSSAAPNTGGGGGGSCDNGTERRNGGSGRVIVRYPKPNDGLPSIPVVAPGQTLLYRDALALPVIDSSHLSGFASISTGQLWGNLPNGPTFRSFGGVRYSNMSAGARRWTSQEAPVGTTTFNGSIAIPTAQQVSGGMFSMWVRPSSEQGLFSARVFSIMNNIDIPAVQFFLTAGVDGVLATGTTGTTDNSLALDPDKWYLVWCSWYSGTIEIWIQTESGGSPVRLSYVSESTNFVSVKLQFTGSGNQPAFAGRLAAPSLYSISSLAAGRLAPADFIWPSNDQTVYTVSGSLSTDYAARTIASFDDLVVARLRQVILANFVGWRDSGGSDRSYRTALTTASRRTWLADWEAGNIAPRGDVVEFATGVYRTGANHSEWLSGNGVTYRPASGASADIRASESLAGTWSQPDAINFPKIWRYDGSTKVGSHVWGKDWQSFIPWFNNGDTTLAHLYTSMSTREWSSHARSGVNYISLPIGVTPTSIGPLERSTGNGFGWAGSYVKDVTLQASAMYDFVELESSVWAVAAYLVAVTHVTNAITVVDGVKAYRASKHAHANVYSDLDGFAIFNQLETGFNPPLGENGFWGIGTGAYTPMVDYVAANTTATTSRAASVYIDPIEVYGREKGDGTSGYLQSARSLYYVHGEGSYTKQFAWTYVRNPGWNFFFDPYQESSTDLSTHIELEVVNPYVGPTYY